VNNSIRIQPRGLMTFLILLLVSIGQLAVDVYLPSMPAIVEYYGTTTYTIQMTLTWFLVGFALSQLFYGPLSDSFGRRKIVLVGFVFFILGGVGCIFAQSTKALLYCRFIQGVGAGGGNVLSMAIMRDVYEKKQLAKMTSYLSMAWAIVPMVSPVFGGYIQALWGWKMNFVFLVLIGLIGFLIFYKVLPETKPKEQKRPKSVVSTLKDYQELLINPRLLGNILPVMMLFGIFVAFQNTSAFLLQNKLGLSEVSYGWCLLFVSSGYIIGSYINSLLIERIPERRVINVGLVFVNIFAFSMLLIALWGIFEIWSIIVPVFCILLSTGLVYPNCCTGCLSPFPEKAGTAGALFGCLTFIGGSITSAVVSFLPENTLTELAIVLCVQVVFAAVILQIYFKWEDRSSGRTSEDSCKSEIGNMKSEMEIT